MFETVLGLWYADGYCCGSCSLLYIMLYQCMNRIGSSVFLDSSLVFARFASQTSKIVRFTDQTASPVSACLHIPVCFMLDTYPSLITRVPFQPLSNLLLSNKLGKNPLIIILIHFILISNLHTSTSLIRYSPSSYPSPSWR